MKSDKPPFSWPIPVNIPVPPGGNEKLIPWSQLKFNPLGLYHLRRWQGVFPTERGFFIANQPWFEAADVAWFAAGMHEDGIHDHPRDHFHPLHNDVYREISDAYTDPKAERKALETRVRKLTFDLVRFSILSVDLSDVVDRLHSGTALLVEPLWSYMSLALWSPALLPFQNT